MNIRQYIEHKAVAYGNLPLFREHMEIVFSCLHNPYANSRFFL